MDGFVPDCVSHVSDLCAATVHSLKPAWDDDPVYLRAACLFFVKKQQS
jgi:hypothetical protein